MPAQPGQCLNGRAAQGRRCVVAETLLENRARDPSLGYTDSLTGPSAANTLPPRTELRGAFAHLLAAAEGRFVPARLPLEQPGGKSPTTAGESTEGF